MQDDQIYLYRNPDRYASNLTFISTTSQNRHPVRRTFCHSAAPAPPRLSRAHNLRAADSHDDVDNCDFSRTRRARVRRVELTFSSHTHTHTHSDGPHWWLYQRPRVKCSRLAARQPGFQTPNADGTRARASERMHAGSPIWLPPARWVRVNVINKVCVYDADGRLSFVFLCFSRSFVTASAGVRRLFGSAWVGMWMCKLCPFFSRRYTLTHAQIWEQHGHKFNGKNRRFHRPAGPIKWSAPCCRVSVPLRATGNN